MPTIEVLTSITQEKDSLREDQAWGNAKFICYTDDKTLTSPNWELRQAYDKFKDPRRNSRIHKILIHKFSEADYTIWIDGNMRLVVPPEQIIDKHLGDYDMAVFRHGSRDCLYEEALVCCQLKLDDIETIIEQAKYYEDHDYPKKKGLYNGGFIIRRNSKKTEEFNEAWWADYCRFSRRDQLSLMPAIDKVGLRVNFMPDRWIPHPGSGKLCGIAEIFHHSHFEGNFNQVKTK